jgi:hypothetical protein
MESAGLFRIYIDSRSGKESFPSGHVHIKKTKAQALFSASKLIFFNAFSAKSV